MISNKEEKIIKILKRGGIGVLPTDTLYGLVGSALIPETVKRIYKVRKRDLKKPMIILIDNHKDLDLFGIDVDSKIKTALKKFWPGRVSIIFPCPFKKFKYLHRETQSLAFRLPKNQNLIKILKKTGPLVAPSANPEGLNPALTIKKAKDYFGDKVDFYLDVGERNVPPSKVIKIEQDEIVVLR